MTKKKIRMATSDNPKEQGHTIVGGRPEGNRSLGSGIPRALEVLVKKAAVDEQFKSELLQKRDKLAEELNLPLDASEKAMLGCVPAEHLEQMIRHTQVPENQKQHLVGASAAAIVALVAQLTFASPVQALDAPAAQIARLPQHQDDFYQGLGGIRPDMEPLFDEEPGPAPQVPKPVHKTDSVMLNGTPPHHVLDIDVRGMSFAQAVNVIADECNIQINYSNLSEEYEHKQIEAHVKGQSLDEALLDICGEYVGGELKCTIHFLNEENRIDIEFDMYKAPVVPDPPTGFGYQKDEISNDQQIVRGIRSDVPRPRPTVIEELDDDYDDPFDLKLRDRK